MHEYFIVGGAAAVLLIIALSIRKSIAARGEYRQYLQQAGFFELSMQDDDLAERVKSLAKRGRKERLRLSKPWRASGSYGEYYLYNPFGGEDDPLILTVRSSSLNLPRFYLIPKLPFDGMVGSMLNKLVSSALKGHLPLISMTAIPEFDARYALSGEGEFTVRRFFSDDLIRELLSHEASFAINADRDLFLFDARNMKNLSEFRRGGKTPLDVWRTQLERAEKICALLRKHSDSYRRINA